MFLKKLSMLFFIIGSLLAIFSGSFEVQHGMECLKIIVLLALGVFIGLLNISQKQEMRFLVASVVFVLMSTTLVNLLSIHIAIERLSSIMINFIYLFGSAALVVAIKVIVDFALETDIEDEEAFYSNIIKQRQQSIFHRVWDIIVFFSVAVLFITMILRIFFDVWKYEHILNLVDYIIYIIFLVDLAFLYVKSNTKREFFTRNWLDIIAVIPLGSVFQIAKLGRVAKLVKIFSKFSKAEKGIK
ncbi:hypothetical protein JXB31_02990, partial [Candidatus Woesearchaeota archaeon]|nr:hypothetical protein [Candidatus Woesearchaeota archaeon]